jgi:NhaP-type Na+/H+ or K+/H+ antiporter
VTLLTIFFALLFVYSLVSARVERTVLTAPSLFTVAGIIVLFALPEVRMGQGNLEWVRRIAEAGLVLLLFTDASRTNLNILKHIRNLPVRLLSVGMLLTILLGALAALVVLRQLTIWEAGILAAILAPTDAGLGQIIVNSPRVPLCVRQALNVEAGLNDGLSVPFLLFFIDLAAKKSGAEHRGFFALIGEQLGLGTLIGLGIGLVGGWLVAAATRHKMMAHSFHQLAVVTLPLLCVMACEAVHASMFIAAFVAGLAVQVGYKEAGKHSLEFAEGWGQLFNLSVFFLFGLMLARSWQKFNFSYLLYAVLSLTVVRMLPVAVALAGTGLSRSTVLFMGWFGPRGLASIVLGLVYLGVEIHAPDESIIGLAVIVTVALSIFAHGLSALPGMNLYAAKVALLNPEAPERQEISAAPAQAGV